MNLVSASQSGEMCLLGPWSPLTRFLKVRCPEFPQVLKGRYLPHQGTSGNVQNASGCHSRREGLGGGALSTDRLRDMGKHPAGPSRAPQQSITWPQMSTAPRSRMCPKECQPGRTWPGWGWGSDEANLTPGSLSHLSRGSSPVPCQVLRSVPC